MRFQTKGCPSPFHVVDIPVRQRRPHELVIPQSHDIACKYQCTDCVSSFCERHGCWNCKQVQVYNCQFVSKTKNTYSQTSEGYQVQQRILKKLNFANILSQDFKPSLTVLNLKRVIMETVKPTPVLPASLKFKTLFSQNYKPILKHKQLKFKQTFIQQFRPKAKRKVVLAISKKMVIQVQPIPKRKVLLTTSRILKQEVKPLMKFVPQKKIKQLQFNTLNKQFVRPSPKTAQAPSRPKCRLFNLFQIKLKGQPQLAPQVPQRSLYFHNIYSLNLQPTKRKKKLNYSSFQNQEVRPTPAYVPQRKNTKIGSSQLHVVIQKKTICCKPIIKQTERSRIVEKGQLGPLSAQQAQEVRVRYLRRAQQQPQRQRFQYIRS